ncbi:MAG: hypothetical protein KGI71_05295 [Patescibacteria group bacterium]|nr:hypothetical protein [Patescibacteria group bacterium]
MAADRLAANAHGDFALTKVRIIRDRLVGYAGPADGLGAFLVWLAAGAVVGDYPKRDDADGMYALVVEPDGTAWRYERTPFPILVEGTFAAIGSGAPFASAALYLGKTAPEAVEVAIALDSYCGRGIDTLTLAGGSS